MWITIQKEYLLLERIVIIAVYTRTIDAMRAVPKETLITYSKALCKYEISKIQ